jgi:hypothetical protein
MYNMVLKLFYHPSRQLKIPDGVCLSRPQPRRSTLLSHSHFPSDAVPRVPAHPPPSTHPLPGDRATAARENDSFMFHASSCSETELGDRSTARQQAQGECSGHQTMESLTSMAQRQDVAVTDDQIVHGNQKLHTPHNYPFPLVPGSFREGPNAGTKEHDGCRATSGIPPGGKGPGGRTVDLTSHSVQMEIVQMRDELKRFHDLKLHHRQLAAQLTARMSQGGSETTEVSVICDNSYVCLVEAELIVLLFILQLEERIEEITEQIKRYAPVVHVIATKIKQLVP